MPLLRGAKLLLPELRSSGREDHKAIPVGCLEVLVVWEGLPCPFRQASQPRSGPSPCESFSFEVPAFGLVRLGKRHQQSHRRCFPHPAPRQVQPVGLRADAVGRAFGRRPDIRSARCIPCSRHPASSSRSHCRKTGCSLQSFGEEIHETRARMECLAKKPSSSFRRARARGPVFQVLVFEEGCRLAFSKVIPCKLRELNQQN